LISPNAALLAAAPKQFLYLGTYFNGFPPAKVVHINQQAELQRGDCGFSKLWKIIPQSAAFVA